VKKKFGLFCSEYDKKLGKISLSLFKSFVHFNYQKLTPNSKIPSLTHLSQKLTKKSGVFI
jgi:hypothetical protein